jgi:TRAP-type C4-dicarboxylate transport system substrate-binding protein
VEEKKMKFHIVEVVAFTTVLMSSCLAQAQDAVTLKFGTHLTGTATGVVQGAEVLMDDAEKNSAGKIAFEFYPAEQAGKALQMFDLVRAGAVDVGTVSTAYVSSDKLPLVGVLELPGLKGNTCDVVNAMFALGSSGGAIFESDLKPAGVRVLAYFPYPAFGPAASTKQISKVEDLMGLKLRNAGGLMELAVQKLGGTPVKMPTPEIYQSLSRGTIDGVMYPYITVKDYNLNSVAKYGTTGYSFGTPGDLTVISERRFQSLGKEHQEALLAAGRSSSDHWCRFLDAAEAEAIDALRKSGMAIYDWTAEDKAKLDALTADIAVDWAKKLDGRGKPASKVIEDFKAALAK